MVVKQIFKKLERFFFNMLIRVNVVQECDATKMPIEPNAGNIKN